MARKLLHVSPGIVVPCGLRSIFSSELQTLAIVGMRIAAHRLLIAIPLCLMAVSLSYGQESAEQVDPTNEERLRRHLRKLEWHRVTQLLRWEQGVDVEQKKRANTSSNPRELDLLSEDEDVGVRFFVAANRHTPLATRLALSRDPSPAVRSGVALALAQDRLAAKSVRDVVGDMAVSLAQDDHVLVRLALAGNRRLPDAAYDTLAHDPDHVVRHKLAENPNAPSPALLRLTQDVELAVQTVALQHHNAPVARLVEMSRSTLAEIRLAVCRNVNTPVAVLDTLATDPDPFVRRLVANHPNTELTTLRRLARDSDIGVLVSVAQHPSADRRLLMKLAYDDRDPGVRLAAQNRLEPLLRSEIREDVMEREGTD